MNSFISMARRRCSIVNQSSFETVGGPRRSSPGIDPQKKRLHPEDFQANPFGINSFEDGYDIPGGKDIGNHLYCDRHIGDGIDKAGKNESRQDKKE